MIFFRISSYVGLNIANYGQNNIPKPPVVDLGKVEIFILCTVGGRGIQGLDLAAVGPNISVSGQASSFLFFIWLSAVSEHFYNASKS